MRENEESEEKRVMREKVITERDEKKRGVREKRVMGNYNREE